MPTHKPSVWNVPNALSAYRILALPFLVYTIASGNKQLFIVLLAVNLITDILDGLIARLFRLQTEFGAKLDSLADIGTYLMAFAGMIVLEGAFVTAHRVAFIVLMALWVLPQVVSLIRFGRFPSFHLWSNKITGYLQGVFIFTFFVFGYYPAYFYVMLAVSYLAYLEELVLVATLPQLRSNLRSAYFVFAKGSPKNYVS